MEKTYLTTKQHIEIYRNLSAQQKLDLRQVPYVDTANYLDTARLRASVIALDSPWFATWSNEWNKVKHLTLGFRPDQEVLKSWMAAKTASIAINAKDKLTDRHFEILTNSWTSSGLSLFAQG